MLSERQQRQVDRFLDEAEAALAAHDWGNARIAVEAVLALDAANADARAFLTVVERAAGAAPGATPSTTPEGALQTAAVEPAAATPNAFCDGRYEVKRFLGEGGKKRVFLAHDTKLDRDVAFALIKTDGLDDEGLLRIRREAQAMGRLGDHPHIVSVYDIGELPPARASALDGGRATPFLVSQLMAGGDVEGLIERADNHRVPLASALTIADQVCQALAHAHAHGIVHRDLKPGNVWLTADGTAKLGDFGLAVALDRTRLTQAGMMVGTVSYMPPEQAIGGEVTPRSDLYSLGAMLYELTTGRPPFVGDEAVAIITQHLNTPPVAPTWHAQDLPPALEALILRLLEKDPAKRPASAAEVRQLIAGVVSDIGHGSGAGPSPGPSASGMTDGATGLGASGANPIYRRVFVGREAELKQLQVAFDAALSGQGSLIAVVGEPGIGKTALCEQIATYAAVRGGKTLVGHSYEEGSLSLPYLAFVESLRSYVLARDPDGLKQDLGSGAAEIARIISEVRDRVPVELRPAGDPEDDRWRLFQAVTGFLRNAAQVQPVLLVLEDLHWADRGTLDYLLHLARNLTGARLLVLVTYRDVEVDRAHPLSGTLAELRRVAAFQRIALRGLTVDEVHRMMNTIRGNEVPWSAAEAIHRQTEGNPLFVQEVLRYVAEEGIVAREGGRYIRADGGEPGLGIPEGLRDVIGKRLSRLSPECNRLLTVAAVIGREFALDVLSRVARISEDEVLAGLEEGLKVGVLEEQARVGGVLYRFSHAMFRQTLYEELSAARHIRLHQDVGRAIEEVHARRIDDHTSELAEHFSHSSDPTDLAKAVAYGERGAQRAMAAYAYGEAIRLLERAIEVQEVLDPDDTARRCDLTLALGRALLPAGEPRRAHESAAPTAFALAEELGDRARAASAALLALAGMNRATTAAIASGGEEWRVWCERADRYAAPGTLERVHTDLALAARAQATRDRRRRRALIRGAVSLAGEIGDAEAAVEATYQLLFALDTPLEEPERAEAARRVVASNRASASARGQVRVLWRAAYALLAAGDREAFESIFREIASLVDRTPDAGVQVYPLFGPATLAILDGDLEGALDVARRIAERGEEVGATGVGRINSHHFQLRPLLHLGRGGDVLAWDDGGFGGLGPWRGVLALAHCGRLDEARSAAQPLYAQANQDEFMSVNTLAWLLEAITIVGDGTRAGVLAERLRPAASAVAASNADATCFARHVGGAAHLAGDYDSARALYDLALEASERVRFRPEIALTRLQLAELLLDDGFIATLLPERRKASQETALRHLGFAVDELRAMKMHPGLERALRHKGLLHA